MWTTLMHAPASDRVSLAEDPTEVIPPLPTSESMWRPAFIRSAAGAITRSAGATIWPVER